MILTEIISAIVVLLILISITWALVDLNRNLKQKIKSEKIKLFFYKKEIKKIQKKRLTEKSLEELNKLARNFFKERINLKTNLTYLELSEKFKEIGKDKPEKFCILMSNLLYTGKEITSREIRTAINLFLETIKIKIKFPEKNLKHKNTIPPNTKK